MVEFPGCYTPRHFKILCQFFDENSQPVAIPGTTSIKPMLSGDAARKKQFTCERFGPLFDTRRHSRLQHLYGRKSMSPIEKEMA